MPYIIRTSAARMPTTCWGRYRHVAVIEVYEGFSSVSMISERARGVKRIIERWDRLHVGRTSECAYQKALKEAEALQRKLSDEAKFNRVS